jgi:hypothetical protein
MNLHAGVQDLVKKTSCFNAATWQGISSDEMAWRISCWTIDAESQIFCAMRTHLESVPPIQMYDIDEDLASEIVSSR